MRDAVKREQRIRPDFLDKDHERASERGCLLDQRRAPAEVARVARQPVVRRGAVVDRELAVGGGFGKGEVERGVPRGDAELGVIDDVVDPLAAVVHLASVSQAVEELLRRAQ